VRQGLQQQRAQLAAEVFAGPPRQADVLVGDAVVGFQGAAGQVVGELAGQHQAEDGPEAVDVGPRVGLGEASLGLLGGHERQRAHGQALLRDRRVVRPDLLGLGQAEVQHVRLAVVADEDVGGLQVAVDDALSVGEGDGPADGEHQLQDLPPRQVVGADVPVQRHAVDQLHRVVVRAVVQPAAVHARDVRMLQRGRQLDLPLET